MQECSNYEELNTHDRSHHETNNGSALQCDDSFHGMRWYRFMGDGGTTMPTSCVPLNRCGTHHPGWLQGSHPTQEEWTVYRSVCFTWPGDCCKWSTIIRVRNCGEFYLYDLTKAPVCDSRYCSKGKGKTENTTCLGYLKRKNERSSIENGERWRSMIWAWKKRISIVELWYHVLLVAMLSSELQPFKVEG